MPEHMARGQRQRRQLVGVRALLPSWGFSYYTQAFDIWLVDCCLGRVAVSSITFLVNVVS